MAWPYDYKWQKARLEYLCLNPLCVECERLGKTTAAMVVDHIKPHRNNMELFWDQGNWQALCKQCHDSYKQRLEKSGVIKTGADRDGFPSDPNHHWNQ